MSRLEWGLDKSYAQGVDRGALYLGVYPGIAWNGLVSVDESVVGGEVSTHYFNGTSYLGLISSDIFACAVSAYTYPEELEDHIGNFGFTYRNQVPNGYQIHLVYQAAGVLAPMAWRTIGASPELALFRWDFTTSPPPMIGIRPTSHFVIDTRYVHPANLALLEDMLYGTESTDPYLPDMAFILEEFGSNVYVTITDHGDGTWTADGPDDLVHLTGPTEFEISYQGAVYISSDTYTLTSM
jgi:hypothetical protein